MFRRLHDFLVIQSEQGNISRQEAVSMIPPLMMDLKPNQTVKPGLTFIKVHDCSAEKGPRDVDRSDVNNTRAARLIGTGHVRRARLQDVPDCRRRFPRRWLLPLYV
jgi:hypothetical protein